MLAQSLSCSPTLHRGDVGAERRQSHHRPSRACRAEGSVRMLHGHAESPVGDSTVCSSGVSVALTGALPAGQSSCCDSDFRPAWRPWGGRSLRGPALRGAGPSTAPAQSGLAPARCAEITVTAQGLDKQHRHVRQTLPRNGFPFVNLIEKGVMFSVVTLETLINVKYSKKHAFPDEKVLAYLEYTLKKSPKP